MRFLVKARSFLRNLLISGRVERDLDEEIRSHLDLCYSIPEISGWLPNSRD